MGGAGGGLGGRSAGGSAGSAFGGAPGGAGGAAGTGAGGAGLAGGGAGGAGAADPSEGCGKGGRPGNGVVTVANQHIYTFPATYDGTKPFPLFIGMHAAGNPIDQIQTLTNGSGFETGYVRAFPKSAGNEWVYNTDRDKVLDMYDELLATYCIDESRVFSAGHSSGAQMIVQILTHADAAEHIRYKAVAPVAASNYGAITRPIPVMYIQGAEDSVRNSDGADVVARFTTVNGCATASMPYAGVASCMSSGTAVDPGCVAYQDCTEPTIWCSHDDPQYSNTNHGWPCFATKAMHDFFTALP
jgi:polyhydroxybutyrate depolymerase